MATKKQDTNKAKITGETLPADSGAANTAVASFGGVPEGFKLKRVITVPSLTLKELNRPYYLKFNSDFRVSKVKSKDGEPPATICDVTDLETGQAFILLAPAVVLKNLQDEFPDGGFVGKLFCIQNLGKRKAGQRYVDFGIAELEAA